MIAKLVKKRPALVFKTCNVVQQEGVLSMRDIYRRFCVTGECVGPRAGALYGTAESVALPLDSDVSERISAENVLSDFLISQQKAEEESKEQEDDMPK